MAEIKNILFPVDFTSASEKVLPYVRYFVEKLEAKLVVIFVVEKLSKYANFYVPHSALDNLEEEMIAAAEKKMAHFVDEYMEDLSDVETIVKRGEVAEEIVKTAEEKNIDLIIMGTHGRKGLEKILLGSVAQQVIKRAPCPVMTVNPHYQK